MTKDDLIARLKHAIATSSNDDESKPGTEKRQRQIDRISTMLDAIEYLESLSTDIREGD